MQILDIGRGRPTADVSRQKAAGILIAAREAFCRWGYRPVTMRQIAEAAQVSTRTLYNQYKDKFSLFEACLEFGSSAFPVLEDHPSGDVGLVLRGFAIALVKVLSGETSQSLGMLVYREGAEFPELIRASERNQQEYLVRPLAAFLLRHGLAEDDGEQRAKILLAMMLSGWHRRVSFRLPTPSDEEQEAYAALVVRLFLEGAASRKDR
ncbi:AcrR family transcriptional regulator [Sphingobium sp. OAS761]|uniref:TetR/AcrR family transcriptional regulator n=1 Tax=Sphingobium sp. OAS761 TaxID=2817901 RepID=UPI00209D8CC4|nr:TetR/AcrR family transcriptional regulator [Sphingobium sp. OAS761]MCP1471466.1 AcrR family transcriptional regulator [Sphingobium sp. OAS761]